MSAPVDVVGVLASVAGASNEIFRLVGSQLQKDAAEARAAVAELIEDLKRIQRRAVEHQDDNDADRKRNLYHIKSIADSALARVSGEPA